MSATALDALEHVDRLRLPDAARFYAAAGVPVFPCAPGEKRPLTMRGFRNATTDLEQVGAWWSRWPRANLGMPTGPVSGVEVVDVDIHDSDSGYGAWERARDGGLVEGWGALVRTPSGGLHAYYPAGAREQRSWQAPRVHVDFRGTGGYVVVPPSRVAAGVDRVGIYELIATATTPPAPIDAGRLREFLDPRAPVTSSPTGPVRDVDAARLSRWVSSLVEGERNHGLFWAACRLAEAGTAPAEALAMLGPAAEHAGLGSREASATIRSAYRSARPQPRPHTPAGGPRETPRRMLPAVTGQVLS